MIPAGVAIVVLLMLGEFLVQVYAGLLRRRAERAFWARQQATAELYDWARELDL